MLRLRGAEARRDGLERVQLPDGATLGDLRRAIQEQLGVITGEQVLSKEQGLLTAKEEDCATFRDLGGSDTAALEAIGVRHGEQLFLRYFFDREVASGCLRHAAINAESRRRCALPEPIDRWLEASAVGQIQPL